ncbi:ferredoxin--NADP reductase [Spirosoma utsteinense]|uniref:Ring-1,2-phenylacetyl-CoA epoxidase subunit PaaE n=1 Tax=Spirosoma utsteinense TaxID=2585773 RepID=A0ABR6W3H6_9BACT|nr:ferredoxin--NADP reductase [Spirosoma utsteinense]MBC3784827.1 ring-1,2-phenylacetyl-CoA epoxidase subunit PaaE [Spirosoma utsteinense]MBC3791135.1 ring-1,2-phenylacetyl-CoA epoxidase subunit PaaE [Spirosoma utsteinense]
MTNFLQLRVARIKQEIGTPGQPEANSYFLESVDGSPVPYQAGQFLTLILNHRPGEAGLSSTNDHEVRRSYSLSSVPGEPLRLTIKRVQNGEMSRYLLDTIHEGDVLTSLYPAGRFTLDPHQTGDLILIGAGSGITPLFGLLKAALQSDSSRRVVLLYSSTSEHTIIFRDELDDLHKRYPNRFKLVYLLSNPSDDWFGGRGTIRRGRLNNVMLETMLPELIGSSDQPTLRFYVCGPVDYMRMVQFTLVFSGIKPEQIRRENFVIEPIALAPPPALAQDRTLLLRLREQEIAIQVPAYKSILQAALDQGLTLPYSCRGGRCSTCIARCTAGSVHMTINDVLTERDLTEGWILTCTGYPESDGVVIEI